MDCVKSFKQMMNARMVEIYNSYPNTREKEWYTQNCSFFILFVKRYLKIITYFILIYKMHLIRIKDWFVFENGLVISSPTFN